MSKPVSLTLLTKPGCHLCDDARVVVEAVLAERGEGAKRTDQGIGQGAEIAFEELNILEDPKLARKHSEHIPVVLINGKRHSIWNVDPVKLGAALDKAVRR